MRDREIVLVQRGRWQEESGIEKLEELRTLIQSLTIKTRIVYEKSRSL